MTLKLGIIGMSEGNGHPYSWAAICNGYSPKDMEDCGFPVIPQYLAQQKWPKARIPGVEVTHVWTQDEKISAKIAKASLIPHVSKDLSSMIGAVDAVLLARDDAENHPTYAAPFLKAGIPIYIDKPIALSIKNLDALYQQQQFDHQIFTCSALRYAKELALSEEDSQQIGVIKHIQAVTPKSWEKYAIHIIEPVLRMLPDSAQVIKSKPRLIGERGRALTLDIEGNVTVDLVALGHHVASPISIRVHGEYGWCDLVFLDSFSAFKSALLDFIDGIKTQTCRSPYGFNKKVVSVIESGMLI